MTDIELGNLGEFPKILQFSGTGKISLKRGRSGNPRGGDKIKAWGISGTKFLKLQSGDGDSFFREFGLTSPHRGVSSIFCADINEAISYYSLQCNCFAGRFF